MRLKPSKPIGRFLLLGIVFSLLCSWMPEHAFSQTTGRIKGSVVDSLLKTPIPNARVRISGPTRSETLTDSLGRFRFLSMPSGLYRLEITKDGFQTYQNPRLLLLPNEMLSGNFSLNPLRAFAREVVITGTLRSPMSSRMEKTSVITKARISELPYEDAATIVGLNSGVIPNPRQPELFYVRGGRLGETAVFFDGMIQNSPLDYSQPFGFDAQWMEHIALKSGFNARYGHTLSGVLHFLTRVPDRDRYEASISTYSDAVLHDYGYQKFSSVFSGPFHPELNSLSFLSCLTIEKARDASPAFGFSGRDGAGFNQWQSFLKLVYKPSTSITTTAGWLHHRGANDIYSSKRAYSEHTVYRRNPEGDILGYDVVNENSAANSGRHQTGVDKIYLRLNSFLLNNVLIRAQASFGHEQREEGDKRFWRDFQSYRQNASIGSDAFGLVNLPGNPYNSYWREELTSLEGRLDLDSFWKDHEFQIGGFVRRYALKIAEFQPELLPENDPTLNLIGFSPADIESHALQTFLDKNPDWFNPKTDQTRNPIMAGFYVQDHLQKNNIGLSAGVRLDYFNPNTRAIRNLKDPFVEGSTELDYTNSVSRVTIQPRLSFRFATSERLFFHAHAGRYAQMPPLRLMMAGEALLRRYMQGGRGLRLVSAPNPNLKPEKTTTYELGAQVRPKDWFWVDLTLFYKQTRDLIQTVVLDPSEKGSLPARYIYGNADFGTIKGTELSFEAMPEPWLSLRGSYTLQFASGTNTTPDDLFEFFRRYSADIGQLGISEVVPNTVHPLDFDRRHVFSLNVNFRLQCNLNLNVQFLTRSGAVYTPRALTYDPVTDLSTPELVALGPKNSETGPWSHQVDFKLTKTLKLAEKLDLKFYIIGINVLNFKIEEQVYETTGRAGRAGFSDTEGFNERINTLVEQITDPQLQLAERHNIATAYRRHYQEQERAAFQFGQARQFKLGVSVSF